MKIALFSDIHANQQALDAVWKDIKTIHPEEIYCLGDLVGYGPHPNEVVQFVRTNNVPTLMGNYDKGGFGDLYVFISVKEDRNYDRDGDDLIRKLGINFDDMILGTDKKINSLYGKVKIKIPKLSKPETVLRISDHGLPNMNTHKRGDLYLILQPEFPTSLSTEQAAVLSLFKKTK